MEVIETLTFKEVIERINKYITDNHLNQEVGNQILTLIFRKSSPEPSINRDNIKQFLEQNNLPEEQTDLLYGVLAKENTKYIFKPETTLYDSKIVDEVLKNIQIE